MTSLIDKIDRVCSDLVQVIAEAIQLGATFPEETRRSSIPAKTLAAKDTTKKTTLKQQFDGKSKTSDTTSKTEPCRACGREACTKYPNATCFFTTGAHPGINTSLSSWEKSANAKAYMVDEVVGGNKKPFTAPPTVLPASLKLPSFSQSAWDTWQTNWAEYRKEKSQSASSSTSSSSSSSKSGNSGKSKRKYGSKLQNESTDPLLHLAQAVYDNPEISVPKKAPDWAYYCRTVAPKARTTSSYVNA